MLGFDFGSHELKIVQMGSDNAVLKAFSAELPENYVSDGKIVYFDAMADFIKETLKGNGFSGKDVACVLPEGASFIRHVDVPYMTPDKLVINLPYEFKDFLTADKTKYYYSYTINEVKNDEEGNPSEMDIIAGATFKETIEEYRAMFSKAGLKLKYAAPAEIAFSNIIKAKGDYEDREFCILDLGHVSTRLDFYKGCIFDASRSIEVGLVQLDKLISSEEGIDEHLAHSYKESNHKDVLSSEAAQDIYQTIAGDVRKSINFYGLNHRDSELTDVFVGGGGGGVKQLLSVLEEQLDGIRLHNISGLFPSVQCECDNPGLFAGAVGAVIGSDFNLAQKEKSEFRPQRAIPLLALVLVAAALFAKFGVFDRYQKLSQVQSELNALKSQETTLMNALADYDEVQAEYNRYSTGWMTEDEQALLLKTDVLKLVEKELASRGTVTEIASSGNAVTCQIAGITLNEASGIVDKLFLRDDVANVLVSSAESELKDTKTKDEDGNETESTSLESMVSITIVMQKPETANAEGGQGNA